MQEEYDESHPRYYLEKYKVTTTPHPCRVCGRAAYFSHPDLKHLCYSHFLDLLNVGEMRWNWSDHEDIWQVTERLLAKKSGFANAAAARMRGLVGHQLPLDGLKKCYKCGETKGIEAFSRNASRLDGLQNHCRKCHNAYRRAKNGR
jgi:hypothetical protein